MKVWFHGEGIFTFECTALISQINMALKPTYSVMLKMGIVWNYSCIQENLLPLQVRKERLMIWWCPYDEIIIPVVTFCTVTIITPALNFSWICGVLGLVLLAQSAQIDVGYPRKLKRYLELFLSPWKIIPEFDETKKAKYNSRGP